MASINEVVAQEALDNLKKLGDNLDETEKKMASLIPLVKEFADVMNKTMGLKDTINSINNLNNATENLHNTNVKMLDIEREIKRESKKMASTIMKESELWKKVGDAMGKVQVDMNELTGRIVENNIKLKENQKAQKEASDAISKAQKDYKNGIISIKEYNDIYDKNFEKLQLAIETQQELKAQLSEQQITLKNVTKEQASAAGSMDEMSQKLGNLRDAYRGLSEEERNNAEIGGVMKAGINQLDEALKALDTSIGNNQRNVGNYSIASQSLVTELRNMKNELLETKININYFTDEIIKQKAILADLAKSHGENSKEYKDAQKELENLQSNQQNYINTSKDLAVAIKDLTNEQKLNNAEIKMMTDPSLAFKTLTESVNLAVQSYTAYKGVLAFVGSENKELEQTIQKLMGLMMAANSVQKVTNALLAQNGVITKTKVLWEKVSINLSSV
jgi:chromosome segregation ATPase